jgi:hypothetical protein
MIRPDAFAAKNTFGQVPHDEGICLLQRFEVRHGIEPVFGDAEFCCYHSQMTPVPLVAYNAGLGMFGHHKGNNVSPVFDDLR